MKESIKDHLKAAGSVTAEVVSNVSPIAGTIISVVETITEDIDDHHTPSHSHKKEPTYQDLIKQLEEFSEEI